MTQLLCQVCGQPADRDGEGVLWLVGEDPADRGNWPDPLPITHPPVCAACAARSVRACPHLRQRHALLRVRSFHPVGVRGALYQPGRPAPVLVGVFGVALDDPLVRWVKAGQLVVGLRDFSVIET